jgi:hypothetical protein
MSKSINSKAQAPSSKQSSNSPPRADAPLAHNVQNSKLPVYNIVVLNIEILVIEICLLLGI